jgi:solute carrier family 25 (mitochondrial folate transporter), member 32
MATPFATQADNNHTMPIRGRSSSTSSSDAPERQWPTQTPGQNPWKSSPLRHPIWALEVLSTKVPQPWMTAFCGAMAGVASGIVTCPLDVIKTKLQAQGGFRSTYHIMHASSHRYHGLKGTARMIWKQDGIRGMYRGLGPMLLGYLPTWAVYMAVYERSKEVYYKKLGMA